ncbi:MAG: thioredoxin-dependent thiol peroxidase [Verrucomicrobiota bacterium]|nr:thioredoxin-dependent thiol peroxidase [Verrucomicrobiota bacterium]
MTTPQKTSPKMKKVEVETLLKAGQKAPEFKSVDETGAQIALKDFKGKKVVLYFYPKDDTPGCTTEACAFRDGFKEIAKKGAVILGVSPDPVKAHLKFKEKFNLNFSLVSDESKTICEAYGVWKEKSMYGRKYMGVERTTFIIDEVGKITKIFPKVSVSVHYGEVLDALN